MDAKHAFEELLTLRVSPWMRSRGFLRKGYRFARWTKGSAQVVALYVWNERSTPVDAVFTIDIGILIGKHYWYQTGHTKPKKQPEVADCHWADNLGTFLPSGQPQYWHTHDRSEVPRLAGELLDALEAKGFPVLERLTNDKTMMELWKTGKSPGLTDMQRLVCVSYLLLASGRREGLRVTLEELRRSTRGLPSERTADEHISRIRELAEES